MSFTNNRGPCVASRKLSVRVIAETLLIIHRHGGYLPARVAFRDDQGVEHIVFTNHVVQGQEFEPFPDAAEAFWILIQRLKNVAKGRSDEGAIYSDEEPLPPRFVERLTKVVAGVRSFEGKITYRELTDPPRRRVKDPELFWHVVTATVKALFVRVLSVEVPKEFYVPSTPSQTENALAQVRAVNAYAKLKYAGLSTSWEDIAARVGIPADRLRQRMTRVKEFLRSPEDSKKRSWWKKLPLTSEQLYKLEEELRININRE